MKFVDDIEITIQGGHGGRGIVSFEQEKFRPWGGPDGGNGGEGGSVYIRAHSSLHTLGKLLQKKKYKALNGQPGRGRRQTGASAELIERLGPVGTQVIDVVSGDLLADLYHAEASYLGVRGGKGGLGNYNFATATRQKPEYAQLGLPGEERHLFLQLKILADVGLVGLPNAGKSSLLAAVSDNKPKIANYPFTTLVPNIGVVENEDYRRFYLADIPGIIEGASQGSGLGLSFLKHIERVGVIVYLIDAERFNFEEEIKLLQVELSSYNEKLLQRSNLVVINKCDLIDYDEEMLQKIRQSLQAPEIWKTPPTKKELGVALPKIPEILFISAKEKQGIQTLIKKIFDKLPSETQAEKEILSRANYKEPIIL